MHYLSVGFTKTKSFNTLSYKGTAFPTNGFCYTQKQRPEVFPNCKTRKKKQSSSNFWLLFKSLIRLHLDHLKMNMLIESPDKLWNESLVQV